MVICVMLIGRVCMKHQKFIFGRYNPNLFFILHENNLSTNVFLKCILAVEIRLFVVAL